MIVEVWRKRDETCAGNGHKKQYPKCSLCVGNPADCNSCINI